LSPEIPSDPFKDINALTFKVLKNNRSGEKVEDSLPIFSPDPKQSLKIYL